MRVIKLTAENIKKLIAVEIEPKGNVIKITGKNASGKTSVLDCIAWALDGARGIQEKPVRDGEDHAVIKLDTGEFVVTRSFTEIRPGGGYANTQLRIENKNGMFYKSPQHMLDGLLGELTFDPLQFLREDPFETLRKIVGLNTDELDKQKGEAYSERTLVNREVKRLEVLAAEKSVPEPASLAPVDIGELLRQFEQAEENQKRLREHAKGVETTQAELLEVNYKIHGLQIQERELVGKLASLESTSPVFEGPTDPDAIKEKLTNAEAESEALRKWHVWGEAIANVQVAKEKAMILTEAISSLETEKNRQLAAVTFPLPGLSFGDGEVLYNGLPLSQASSAEQLRVSVAIAMGLNPKLRVLRITDGSLLDSTSMGIIEEMCAEHDYQVWVEIVEESGKMGIVIDEGQVVAVNE